MIFLTVYPIPDPTIITATDIDNLAFLCAGVNKAGRKMFLRFAPEMNGNWQIYGQKATLFKKLYIQIANAVRSKTKNTAMVWSPNEGTNYPFGNAQFTPNSTDLISVLDTNKNGILDVGDDPYAPYYPGDEYVDWVSLSVYFFGINYPWINNVLPPAGIFEKYITSGLVNFYRTYAVGHNKPMFIAETAASYHTYLYNTFDTPSGVAQASNPCAAYTAAVLPAGPGILAMKRNFWSQFLTNSTFMTTAFPQVKAFGLFEFAKR
ncbi:hypothetical protein HK096_002268, partial [Nowakowskiella sp. JEL0078]